jgi:hypothetical protein
MRLYLQRAAPLAGVAKQTDAVRVLRIDPEEREIGLSIKRADK